MEIKIFYSENWPSSAGAMAGKTDYELLGTGGGEKVERFGPYTFVRPYEEAVWPKTLKNEWQKSDGKFWSSKVGAKAGWKMSKADFDKKWEMEYRGIKFFASPTPFRHLGFFPEQAAHWDFIEKKISSAISQKKISSPFSLPRVPGWTGVASLFALRAGAEVTHVDASKQILNWAKENQN